jgi:hypothetical protein
MTSTPSFARRRDQIESKPCLADEAKQRFMRAVLGVVFVLLLSLAALLTYARDLESPDLALKIKESS